jgi:hypothetical protein
VELKRRLVGRRRVLRIHPRQVEARDLANDRWSKDGWLAQYGRLATMTP